MQRNYQSFENMSWEEKAGSWRNFFTILSGTTGGAHQEIVNNLTSAGHSEVQSPEEADYLLVFCPVVTRVGTDIGEALEQIPAQKPAVLVVMHQTFDTNRVVADSRRQVNNPNVCLTVDCLFYEGKFLKCSRNDISWGDIQKLLNIPISEAPKGSTKRWWNRSKPIEPGVQQTSSIQAGSEPGVQQTSGSWRNFFTILSGATEGAHLKIVNNLTRAGHSEVQSPEEADYLLVFCPVVTRVGTDIGKALEHIPAQKPAVLVVMHQTFDPNRVVADSRRQVNNPNVCLTVDCLFYKGELLKCSRNDISWGDIQKLLNIPISESGELEKEGSGTGTGTGTGTGEGPEPPDREQTEKQKKHHMFQNCVLM
ncbi:uncharacterized protein ACNS7B_002392 isoform 1-T1 [Menidia menidia]